MQLPRYEAYKDSGVEWLGEIPEHWGCDCIRAATTLKSDKNQPDLQVLSVYREYGVILKNSRDDNHNATSLDTSTYKAVKPGDLVVNKMKAWQGSMGVSEHEGIVSPAYITCKTNQHDFYSKYLHYLLRSKTYVNVYNAISYGVRIGQWDLRYEDFKKITIPIPAKTEQKRIASFLDQKTSEIDEAIAKKQKLIELLQEQKSILINQAVTKGLNPDAPMKDSGVEWIGEIPAHWEVKRLKYYLTEIDERSQSGDEELLSVSHMTGVTPRAEKTGIYMFMAADYKGSKICQEGDLVVNIMWAWMGALGVSGMTGIVSPSYGVYRQMKKRRFTNWFLEHTLRSGEYVAEYNRRSTGLHSSRLRLYSDYLLDMQIASPSFEEQAQIEQKVIEHSLALDEAIGSVSKEVAALNEFKQSVISSAVTGKIKV